MKKHYISLKIILGFVLGKIKRSVKFAGYWIEDLALHKGSTGAVLLDVDEQESDGRVYFFIQQADKTWVEQSMTYRIFNRWLTRHRRPDVSVLWSIKTATELSYHVRVSHVQWGLNAWNKTHAKPFDISKLPSEEEVHARYETKRKLHAWLERHFPTREQAPVVGPHDIIIR